MQEEELKTSEHTKENLKMQKTSLIQFEKTVVCPLESGRNVIRTEFRERCFMYQSFGQVESDFGDMHLSHHLSFLADNGNGKAAEWEPKYGPIQLWTECDENWRGEQAEKPRIHWHFPLVEDKPLAWSQLAVDREGLKNLLVSGDLEAVFDVLMRWADH